MIKNINFAPSHAALHRRFNPVHYSSTEVSIEDIRRSFPDDVLKHELIFSESLEMTDDLKHLISGFRVGFVEDRMGLRVKFNLPPSFVTAVFQMYYSDSDVITRHGHSWDEAIDMAANLTGRSVIFANAETKNMDLIRSAIEQRRRIIDPAVPNANALYFRTISRMIERQEEGFKYILFSPDIPDYIIPVMQAVYGIDRCIIAAHSEPEQGRIPVMAGAMHVDGFVVDSHGISDPAMVHGIRTGDVEFMDLDVNGIILTRDHP
ncbi:hypothetical protein [Thermoplasma sp.]|uniref:hypothetical protein n=1 Tax=Thermoplasma sp. TaxID=1973142 RepID=UPI00127C6B9F|nr:hypothetical protein [Thermoplasma sp.]KAA8921980.1 MAG: hypothetical protein F6Q11_06725 [Thermoplasma sp.]